jgi:hypothetical protein
LRQPVALVAIAVIVVAAVIGVLGALDRILRAPSSVGDAAANTFNQVLGNRLDKLLGLGPAEIHHHFAAYVQKIEGTQRLQVVTWKGWVENRVTETWSLHAIWAQVQVRAPAECTYYLDLQRPWEFQPAGKTLYVLAPELRPNEPAIDLTRIERQVLVASWFIDAARLSQDAEAHLGARAQQYAAELAATPELRKEARQAGAQFIRTWILRDFADGKEADVRVLFPDEPRPAEAGAPATRKSGS